MAEAQQKHVEYLQQPLREPVTLPPLVEPTYLSKDQLEASIKRLYDDSIAHKTEQKELMNQRFEEDMVRGSLIKKNPVISGDESHAIVTRLYEESIQHHEQTFKELYEAEMQANARLRKPTKSMTKAEEQSFYVDHLYNEGVDKERAKHIALYQKFVLDRLGERRTARRTPAQVAAAAEKLATGS